MLRGAVSWQIQDWHFKVKCSYVAVVSPFHVHWILKWDAFCIIQGSLAEWAVDPTIPCTQNMLCNDWFNYETTSLLHLSRSSMLYVLNPSIFACWQIEQTSPTVDFYLDSPGEKILNILETYSNPALSHVDWCHRRVCQRAALNPE